MHRKLVALLLILMLVPVWTVSAEGNLAMMLAPSEFSVGETLHIYFTAPVAGRANLTALDSTGAVCATLLRDVEVPAGAGEVIWDGTENGQPLPAGRYALHLTMGEMSVDMNVTITAGGDGPAQALPSANGLVTAPVEEASFTAMPGLVVEAPAAGAAITPAYKSAHVPSTRHENCYWCTPMDIHNEEAVWAMLTAPITIVDGETQKSQVTLRAEPSDDAQGVGVVTCLSQSVHVLETRDDGWSLVEVYSSSFHDSRVKAWNLFVTGYIPTRRLVEKKPSQEYGMVIDKLTQTLYIFKDGRLFSTLLASTGLYNDRQPYNETRSGEFLIVSRVGEFRSDNMFCSMALRFNSGDLLHEVPHVKNADGTKNYRNTEFKLGTRASHGCIRIQRLRNADGVNMTWVWNNIKVNTKMVIWEDYAGRQIPLPDSSIPLYYNADGGSNYHSAPKCNGVKDEYLPFNGSFTYGELDTGNFAKLTRCNYCIPPLRVAEIEDINEIHKTQSPGEIPQHLRQDK